MKVFFLYGFLSELQYQTGFLAEFGLLSAHTGVAYLRPTMTSIKLEQVRAILAKHLGSEDIALEDEALIEWKPKT